MLILTNLINIANIQIGLSEFILYIRHIKMNTKKDDTCTFFHNRDTHSCNNAKCSKQQCHSILVIKHKIISQESSKETLFSSWNGTDPIARI